MKQNTGYSKKLLSVLSLVFLSLFIVSCGGKDEEGAGTPVPNSAPPPPAAPAGPAAAHAPAPAGVGEFIEDASSGTALGTDSASWNALYKRFHDNTTFYGNATVSGVTALSYTVENAGQTSVQFKRSNPQTLSNQSPTIQIQANGDSIYIQSPYLGGEVFSFQSQISLYGLVLKSTEFVGLYLSGDGSSILKVQYNVKNPPISLFEIETYGGYWNSLNILVTKKVINTSGVSIPNF